MIQIIMGGAKDGMSRELCRQLNKASIQNPSDSYIAIVPEQSTLQMQRTLADMNPSHVVMNIDITSFERLARRVFDELGEAKADILDENGKILILRQVLEEHRSDLAVYSRKVPMPGFTQAMKSVLSELAQYDIDDNDLFLMQESAASDGNSLLYRKLGDIRLVRTSFYDALSQQYTTAENMLSVFSTLVSKSHMIRQSHLYLDGFTGFTPIQYKLLEQLMRYARDFNISLTLPSDRLRVQQDPADLFYLSNKTLQKLKELAEKAGNSMQILSLDHIRHTYGTTHDDGKDCKAMGVSHENDAHTGISITDQEWFPRESAKEAKVSTGIYAAKDIGAEVRYVADCILHGIRREGKRFRDYAVICSDMETYYPYLRDIFTKAGIPCFIDYKAELGNNALARYLVCALGIVSERFSYKSVFSFLKNALSGFTAADTSLLENYCLEFGIHGVMAWGKDFTRNRRLRENEKDYWDLEEINTLRKRVWFLVKDLYKQCKGASQSIARYCAAVKDFLEQNGIEEKCTALANHFSEAGKVNLAKEYEQVYQMVTGLFEQAEQLMGHQEVTVKEFTDLMTGAMNDLKIGIIPPSLDQVVAGDLTRTRLSDVETLFLVGMNEGKVPSGAGDSGLLTQWDRLCLSRSHFELAPSSVEKVYTQLFYLYLMVSKPTMELHLTYALRDMQGTAMEPSYVLEELETLGIDRFRILRNSPEAMLYQSSAKIHLAQELRKYLENPACAEKIPQVPEHESHMRDFGETEMICQAESAGSKEQRMDCGTTIDQLLHYFFTEDPQILQMILNGALFRSQPLPIDEEIALNLYGGRLKGSVSRYEKFYGCPFSHFLSYGLRIEERPEYEVASTDIGTIYHDSLDRYGRTLQELGLSFRNISNEQSHEIARRSMEEAAASLESDAISSTKRNAYILKRMEAVMEKTTDILRLHVKQGLYEPEAFEWEFYVEKENAAFKGKIDRVDIYDGSDVYVKIIDYKSGNKKFQIRDIYTGQQLQLVAYLKEAVEKVQKSHPGREVKPGGVYYYQIQDRFVRSEKEAAEKFRMSGLTSCEPEALKAIDTEVGAGASSSIVEIQYTRSGLGARSKAANDREFQHLLSFVDSKLEEAGKRICHGEVAISPAYESAAKNACMYCPYKDVCKFEAGKWGCDYHTLPEGVDTAQMEREIYGRD